MSGQDETTHIIIVGEGGRRIAEILKRDRVLFNKMLGMAKMEGESATLRPCHLKPLTLGPSEISAVCSPGHYLSDPEPAVISIIEDDVRMAKLLDCRYNPLIYEDEQKPRKSYEQFLPKPIGRQKRRK